MSIKHYIAAAAIATGTLGSQASETFQPEKIKRHDTRISGICNQFEDKTGVLLEQGEGCEYSPDNGLNWYAIGAGTSILALIGAGAIFRSRRKKEQASEIQNIEINVSNNIPNTFGGIIGDESGTQLEEDDILRNPSGIDDGLSEEDQDPTEYPIEKASIAMEYRRYTEAEEILLKVIGKDPENIEAYKKLLEIYYHTPENIKAYKKLLEIYYHTKDIKKFEKVFMRDELAHFFGKGISEEDMVEIRSWGREIDPENPIYIDPIPSEEVISTEIEMPNKLEDPNKTIDTLFMMGKGRTGLDSLELRIVSDALKSENLTSASIQKGSMMIISSYHKSTNPEHIKIVDTYLQKITDAYVDRWRAEDAARYLLGELAVSRNKESICKLLLTLSGDIDDVNMFNNIYTSLSEFPGFKISEDKLAKLKARGKMLNPENPLYADIAPEKETPSESILDMPGHIPDVPEEIIHEKGEQNTIPEDIDATKSAAIPEDIVPISVPDAEKATGTILKADDKDQQRIDGSLQPSFFKRIWGIFQRKPDLTEGKQGKSSQSPVRIRETYAISGKKIESTAKVVKAKDLEVGYPEAVVVQLKKLGFDIVRSNNGKTAIITSVREGSSLKYDPNPNIKKIGDKEFHINNAVSLLYTTRQGVPTIIVRSSSGKPSLIEISSKL